MPPEAQRGRAPAFGTAVAALLALAAPGRAAAQPSPEEASFPSVPALGECGGNVPACSTVQTPVITVNPGQQQRVKVLCGKNSFFWNWTAEASPLLVVSLAARQTPSTGQTPSIHPVRDAQDRPVGAVFLLHEQTGTRAGKGQIAIGCSPEDPTGKLAAQRQHVTTNPARRR